MKNRLLKLISEFPKNKIDSFIVTKDVNIKYLTGYDSCDSWLFITPKKSFYITDSRYILEARKKLKNARVVLYEKSFFVEIFNIAKELKLENIGFEEHHLTVAQLKAFQKECPRVLNLIGVDNLVEKIRELKDAFEIKQLKESLLAHNEALLYLNKIIKPGLTEENIFSRLDDFVKLIGAQFAFEPIIASGVNSCYPHAKLTKRRILENDVVLVDIGIDKNGYKSDLTRMFLLGKIPQFISEIIEKVRHAQALAIRNIKAGTSVKEVDSIARGYLAKSGLDKYFTHSLGHGLGLEVHERPRLSQKDSSILKEGMVVTVEPAVYIPNKFGVRIEDMVLVTKKGCEVLSGYIN